MPTEHSCTPEAHAEQGLAGRQAAELGTGRLDILQGRSWTADGRGLAGDRPDDQCGQRDLNLQCQQCLQMERYGKLFWAKSGCGRSFSGRMSKFKMLVMLSHQLKIM